MPSAAPLADSGWVQLPAAVVSARLARQQLAAVAGCDDPHVALVLTELVTNAVVHAASAPRLRVRAGGATVRLEVADDSPERPQRRHVGAEPATSGRGLALVDLFADEWGVEPAADGGGGKVVWAVVRPARRAGDAQSFFALT